MPAASCSRTFGHVEDPLEAQLPRTYQRVLELAARGVSDDVIAAELAVPVESIVNMRVLARGKLERLRRSHPWLSSGPDL